MFGSIMRSVLTWPDYVHFLLETRALLRPITLKLSNFLSICFRSPIKFAYFNVLYKFRDIWFDSDLTINMARSYSLTTEGLSLYV